jgi:hypothetical protein
MISGSAGPAAAQLSDNDRVRLSMPDSRDDGFCSSNGGVNGGSTPAFGRFSAGGV